MVITKTLDVKLAGSQWVTEAVKGEANARTLHIAFEEEGHSLSLENVAHAYLYARKPSGQYSLINSCTINADNTIDYVETAQTCAEQGIMLCTLVLVDEDGATLYSPQFTIHIFPNEMDQSGIVSASEFTAINEQVASADDSRKRAEAWAVGTMDGEPVPSDDETYENNSKYYAEQAEQIKNDTQDIADDVDEIRDDVLAIKEQAQEIVDDAVDKVIDMTATAHQISVNAQPTVTKTGGDSTPINLDFGMPAPNGIKSIVKTQTVGLNDIYKITFTNNNTFEYVVKNGKDGKDGKDGDVQSDGLYPELAVGTATALIDKSSYTAHNTPYLHRISPSGKRCEYDVIGGTVGWNQLVKNGNFQSTENWSVYSNARSTISASNNILTQTFSGEPTTSAFQYALRQNDVFKDATHKYLFICEVTPSFSTNFRVEFGGTAKILSTEITSNTKGVIRGIADAGAYNNHLLIYPFSGASGIDIAGQTAQFQNAQLIDLTTLLGSTIADYAYTLEQATAGSGIAWLKSFGFLTKSYYPYSEPTLESVQATERKAVGINQWDEEWENGTFDTTTGVNNNTAAALNQIRSKNLIPVIGGQTYYFNISSQEESYGLWCMFYDADGNIVKPIRSSGYNISGNSIQIGQNSNSHTFTMAENVVAMKFYAQVNYGKTYKNDICINISNPTINGTYYPHESHTYPLGNVTLRGIPKLDSSNNIYYDGDVYKADGTVTRKYGIIDLGTLAWSAASSDTAGYNRFVSVETVGVNTPTGAKGNVVCAKYIAITGNDAYTRVTGITLTSAGKVVIYDETLAQGTAAAFKTAMSGIYLVYELATPTTESTDSFTPIQYTGSTEEFSTDNDVPVGVDARYYADMGGGSGTEYTAGTGISISNNAIAINTSGASTGQVLKKTANGVGWANESGGSSYTAGTGISISNNAIAINTSGASTGQVLKKTSNGVGWANESTGTNVVANPTLAGTEDALEGIQVGSTKYVNRPSSMSYITEEPTADNTDGIKIVVLTYEPDTKYDGYIYLIAPWQGTDLTGTIWKLRDRVPDPIEGFDLDFTSNNETFTGLRCEDTPRHLDYNRGEVLYDTIMTSDDVTPTWVNQNYRILNIIDGSGVSAEVIAWFQKNASYEGEI